MTFILNDPEDTMALGKILASAMSGSNVRALYLFAPLGGGKTTLTRGFAAALPGGEDAEVASPSFTLCNEYPTCPRILHADLYRLPMQSHLPEEMEEAADEEDTLTILEWPEHLQASAYAKERLELRLSPAEEADSKYLDNGLKTCETLRSATLSAHGAASEELLSHLLPLLRSRFHAGKTGR